MATDILEPKQNIQSVDASKTESATTETPKQSETKLDDLKSNNKKNYIAITIYAIISIGVIWMIRTGRMNRPFLAGLLIGASLFGIYASTKNIIVQNKTKSA